MPKRKHRIVPGVASNTGAYSPGIAVGNFVFISGQGPLKPGTTDIVGITIEEQTRQTLENVRAVLDAAGCTMDDCVKLNAYLADIRAFDRYNAVYATFFREPLPARTTVQSELWGGILVEIDAIAIKGCGGTKSRARRQSSTGARATRKRSGK
jgi:2-iminobutanoate/2-iminopropanoate deaminase